MMTLKPVFLNHAVPGEDLAPHSLDAYIDEQGVIVFGCWCKPKLHFVPGGFSAQHDALDARYDRGGNPALVSVWTRLYPYRHEAKLPSDHRAQLQDQERRG